MRKLSPYKSVFSEAHHYQSPKYNQSQYDNLQHSEQIANYLENLIDFELKTLPQQDNPKVIIDMNSTAGTGWTLSDLVSQFTFEQLHKILAEVSDRYVAAGWSNVEIDYNQGDPKMVVHFLH